jgi:hypothetical protein
VIAKGGVWSGFLVLHPESSLLSLRLSIASEQSNPLLPSAVSTSAQIIVYPNPSCPISTSNYCRPLSSLLYSLCIPIQPPSLSTTLVEKHKLRESHTYTHSIYLSELGTAGLPLDSSRICFICYYMYSYIWQFEQLYPQIHPSHYQSILSRTQLIIFFELLRKLPINYI